MKPLIIAAAVLSLSAFAEEAPAPVAAKPDCAKPVYPGRLASDGQMKAFNRRLKDYGECMRKFIDAQSAIVKSSSEAANAAINEYNALVKEVQGEQAQ